MTNEHHFGPKRSSFQRMLAPGRMAVVLPLLGLAALVTRPALAGDGGASPEESASTFAKPLAESLTGDAKAAFDAARLLYEDGDAAGASAKFRRAYELSQDPRLLWNMAVCEKDLRHYAKASTLIQRYLKEGEGRLAAASVTTAHETFDALRDFFSSVSLDGDVPAGAKILLDGEPVDGAPFLADLGSRKLRLEAPGYAPFETTFEVPGNTDIRVPVTLKKDVSSSRLSVVTNGVKGTISIDGKVVGEGTWEGALSPGAHQLEVTAPKRKPYSAKLDLLAGGTRTLQVTLEDEDSPLWPWLAGGGALLAGAAVGGYFLFRPAEEEPTGPSGSLGSFRLR